MKKLCGIVLLVAMLIALSGCAYSDNAPTLFIQIGDQVIKKDGAVTDWEKTNILTGSTESVIAEMVFPTQLEYEPICSTAEMMSFSFEEEPKSISLSYYSGKDIGKDIYEVQAKSIKAKGENWPLQDGANIYVVNARWENAISKRSARYCFYIEKTE